jgi:DNA-directed RNA polymerase omega subunit
MSDTSELIQPDPAPQAPSEPAAPITSRFLFVDVAALRAKQLRRGAQPRLEGERVIVPHKAERMAMEEVRHGLVFYDIAVPKPNPEGE